MKLTDWLRPELVFTHLSTPSVKALVERLAAPMAAVAGAALPAVEAALWRGISDEGCSVGRGVAFPHAELKGLRESIVALVVLDEALALPTLDGVPPDVLFCILSPPDAPHQHLLLLAHIARLSQSRVLLDGLRAAPDAAAVVDLLGAAEARHRTATDAAAPPSAGALVTITIAGERAVDALLVELVGMELDDATIIEGQSLREAVAREVPLFSGFRDLFGDPGGRRVILVEAEADEVDEVIAAVRAVCEAHDVGYARVTTLPLATRWEHVAPGSKESGGGH